MPGLVVQNGVHYSSTPRGLMLALTLLMSFVVLNYFGIRLFARINAGFTVWKLIIPSITIISLLSMSYHAENFTQYGGFMPYGWQGVMTAMSSGGVLFSLLGFRQVVIMMSEIENPGKYVPIVLVSSLVVATFIYTALQWSFIGSLRGQDLVQGWSKLSFVGDAGPFAALAALAGMGWLSILLYSDAFISPYSTGLVYSTTAARMLASMGMMQDAPASFALTNKYRTPWISLCINFFLAILMFFLLHNWQAMASFLVAVLMVSYVVGPICVVSLRKQLPMHNRPFRVRGCSLIAFIGFYICTAGVYWSGLSSILKLLILTIIGLVCYLIYIRIIKKSQQSLDSQHAIWVLCYILGLSGFSYFGNYGGNQTIPLYWDLLYLMFFSLIIFFFAYFTRMPDSHTQIQCNLINETK